MVNFEELPSPPGQSLYDGCAFDCHRQSRAELKSVVSTGVLIFQVSLRSPARGAEERSRALWLRWWLQIDSQPPTPVKQQKNRVMKRRCAGGAVAAPSPQVCQLQIITGVLFVVSVRSSRGAGQAHIRRLQRRSEQEASTFAFA